MNQSPTPNDIRAEVIRLLEEMQYTLDDLFGLDRFAVENADDLDDLPLMELHLDGEAQWEALHQIDTLLDRAAALGALYASPHLLGSPSVAINMMGTRFRDALTSIADQLDAARAEQILDPSSRPEELRPNA